MLLIILLHGLRANFEKANTPLLNKRYAFLYCNKMLYIL